MIVVDASVLIAWLDDRDIHHLAAIDVLAAVERFVAHPLTLAEVLVHPARSGGHSDVLSRLEAIGMDISTHRTNPVDLALLRAHSGLKMPDCIVLACALAHGVGVATFDDALRAAVERAGGSPT